MRVRSVDVLHLVANVIFARVKVLSVGIRGDVGRGVAMRVTWEDLCECVTHLKLPVERPVEGSLCWIKTAILSRANCSWR